MFVMPAIKIIKPSYYCYFGYFSMINMDLKKELEEDIFPFKPDNNVDLNSQNLLRCFWIPN